MKRCVILPVVVSLIALTVGLSSDDSDLLKHNQAFKEQNDWARYLAQTHRSRSRTNDPQSADMKNLEADLRKAVAAAFDTRQRQQREQLAKLQKRFKHTQQLIEAREKMRDKIIDHRVDALLIPELQWPDIAETDAPAVEGRIVTVFPNGNLVEISAGHDDGVRKGILFQVYRDRNYVGKIEVVKTDADRSVARVLEDRQRELIRVNDRVITVTDSKKPKGDSPPHGAPNAIFQGQSPQTLTQIGGSSHSLQDAVRGPQVAAQILIAQPEGATVALTTEGEEESTGQVPMRLPTTTGQKMRFWLGNLPGRSGVVLSGSFEIAPLSEQLRAYVEHNAIPLAMTNEDIDQALGGNFVTKVVYLPNAENAELALAGVETLGTTRLDPGMDPVVEADRRGQIVAILRLGNRIPSKRQ